MTKNVSVHRFARFYDAALTLCVMTNRSTPCWQIWQL